MPAYDYRCAECGEIFELTARMGQAPSDPACPKDDGGAGVRVFGSPASRSTPAPPEARSAATSTSAACRTWAACPTWAACLTWGACPTWAAWAAMGTTTVTATTISASTTSSRFPLRLYQVVGDSMAPTLHEAERLLGLSPRWLPRRLQPAVGRIVVFREPREAGKRSIKRIVSREVLRLVRARRQPLAQQRQPRVRSRRRRGDRGGGAGALWAGAATSAASCSCCCSRIDASRRGSCSGRLAPAH